MIEARLAPVMKRLGCRAGKLESDFGGKGDQSTAFFGPSKSFRLAWGNSERIFALEYEEPSSGGQDGRWTGIHLKSYDQGGTGRTEVEEMAIEFAVALESHIVQVEGK